MTFYYSKCFLVSVYINTKSSLEGNNYEIFKKLANDFNGYSFGSNMHEYFCLHFVFIQHFKDNQSYLSDSDNRQPVSKRTQDLLYFTATHENPQ